jgi:hypothetical protein
MQAFLGLVGALIGASASIVTTIAVQRWRHRSEAQGRRDDRLLNLASDFASAVRRLASLADRYSTAADQQGVLTEIDAQHLELRAVHQQLRLIGTSRVQRSARMVLRHVYAVVDVRLGKPDPRQKDFPGHSPSERLGEELVEFYRSVRAQLRLNDAEDVLGDDPDLWVTP